MEAIFRHTKGTDNPVRFAAAVYAYYLLVKPKAVQVWFTYGAGLDRIAEWWQQLWGESLGKEREGARPVGQTPARAVGVTDQHSQLQLYQDGPADKVFTFVRWMTGREKGNVPKAGFAPDMAMLGGRPLRDLFDAEFEGTIGALVERGTPHRADGDRKARRGARRRVPPLLGMGDGDRRGRAPGSTRSTSPAWRRGSRSPAR